MLLSDRNPRTRKKGDKFDGWLQKMQSKAHKLRTLDRQNLREHAKVLKELRSMLDGAGCEQERQDFLNAIRNDMIQNHDFTADDADRALAIALGKYKRSKI